MFFSSKLKETLTFKTPLYNSCTYKHSWYFHKKIVSLFSRKTNYEYLINDYKNYAYKTHNNIRLDSRIYNNAITLRTPLKPTTVLFQIYTINKR